MVNKGSPAPNAPNQLKQWINSFLDLLAGLIGAGQPKIALVHAGPPGFGPTAISTPDMSDGADGASNGTLGRLRNRISMLNARDSDDNHADVGERWEGHDRYGAGNHSVAGASHLSASMHSIDDAVTNGAHAGPLRL